MFFILIVPSAWRAAKSRVRLLLTKLYSGLAQELIVRNGSLIGNRAPLVFSGLFIFILRNNFLGLLPYVFTARRHMRFTLTIRRALWLRLIIPAFLFTPSLFLAHLVPKGTPVVLVPFMVLIELLSNIIRPFTLGIRLAANIIAGHLLLVLISTPVFRLSVGIILVVLGGLFLLTVLELAVSMIQSYVFMRLGALYVREVNTSALN